jgi:membrane protease YdiL (CAAX protease family)
MSTETIAAAAPRPFRLKLLPIALTVVLGLGLPYVAAYFSAFAAKLWGAPAPDGPTLPWLYSQHAAQLVCALIAIAIMKRLVPANYGLQWPPGRTYIGEALLWSALLGVVMTIVDFAPNLIARTAPDPGYPLSQTPGWLFFEGVYVGPTEEIPFRALLVTYLVTTMPGKLRLGSFDPSWAGIIVAAIFALAHVTSFWTEAWPLALGQQLYAFVFGVLYAYWLEKSRSIVAPIIGHNVGDVVETAIVAVWVALAG